MNFALPFCRCKDDDNTIELKHEICDQISPDDDEMPRFYQIEVTATDYGGHKTTDVGTVIVLPDWHDDDKGELEEPKGKKKKKGKAHQEDYFIEQISSEKDLFDVLRYDTLWDSSKDDFDVAVI